MKKKILTLALTAAMAASMGMTAFAGQWVQNTTGWWWQEDNGSYPTSQWKWLDGNKDGIYECYAFDANGYIYTNTTTPDGYTVNKDGAWVVGNSVQLKYEKDMAGANDSSSNGSQTDSSTSSDDKTVYTNEDMVGTFKINDDNREDYYEFMVGANDGIAAIYYDNDGESHVYSFSKVSDTKYRDSSLRNLTIIDYDTVTVGSKTYVRQ